MKMKSSLFYAGSSSVFLTLSYFYPNLFGFLSLFFLVPLLFFLKNKDTNHISLAVSVVLFTIVILISTSWIFEAYPLDWLQIDSGLASLIIVSTVWLLFSLGIATFFAILIFILQLKLFRSFNLLYEALGVASIWVMLEFIRSYLISFVLYGDQSLSGPHHTYYSLAYPVSQFIGMRDYLSIGGIYLASFVVILCNYLAYSFFIEKERKKKLFKILLFLAILISPSVIMASLREAASQKFNIINFQTNFKVTNTKGDSLEKWNEVSEYISKIYARDSIIILPENMNIFLNWDNYYFGNNNLFISSYTGKNYYNMFYRLTDMSESVGFYQKQLLMPLGEYKIIWLSKIVNIIKLPQLINLETRDYAKKGENSYVYKYQGYKIGGVLCSENISPILHRDLVKSGAVVIINIASQAPFHSSDLLSRQTLAINSARALETGRYLIVSTNMGASYILDDKGNVLPGSFSLQKDKKISYLSSEVLAFNYITPYAYFGDYMVVASVLILLLMIIWNKDIKKNN